MDKESGSKEGNLSSLKLLWQSLPVSLKRFAVVVFIVLLCSLFFAVLYAGEAVNELKLMREQKNNYTK